MLFQKLSVTILGLAVAYIFSAGLLDAAPAGISYANQRVTTAAPASGCSLPPEVTNFLTTDGMVYLYFEAHVSADDLLSWDWLAPNGDVLTGGTWNTGAGYFCFGAPILDISNPKPGHFGAWQVRVYDWGAPLFSVAFTVSAPARFTVTGSEIAGLLITDGAGKPNYCAMPDAKSAFQTSDQSVVLWFTFNNAKAGDVLSVNWIHPSGTPDTFHPSSTLSSTGSGCGAWQYSLDGNVTDTGSWQAELLVNGAVAVTLPFALTEPQPANRNLTIANSEITAALVTDASGNPQYCTQPTPQNGFQMTDPKVGVWFSFDNGASGDVIISNWIHPSGAVDSYHHSSTLAAAGSYCYGWFLAIDGNEPATESGNWNVQVLVNGKPAFTLPFTIAPPPETPFTVTAKEVVNGLEGTGSGQIDYCSKPPSHSSFLNTDPRVGVWFTFNNGKTGDVLQINWVHPFSGAVDADQPSTTLTGDGSGCDAWFHALNRSGVDEVGLWQVRLLINGSLEFSLNFNVSPPPSSDGGSSSGAGGFGGVGGNPGTPGEPPAPGVPSGGGSTSSGWLTPMWAGCISAAWDPDNSGFAILSVAQGCPLSALRVAAIRNDDFPLADIPMNGPGSSTSMLVNIDGTDDGFSIFVCPYGYYPADSNGYPVALASQVSGYVCRIGN